MGSVYSPGHSVFLGSPIRNNREKGSLDLKYKWLIELKMLFFPERFCFQQESVIFVLYPYNAQFCLVYLHIKIIIFKQMKELVFEPVPFLGSFIMSNKLRLVVKNEQLHVVHILYR